MSLGNTAVAFTSESYRAKVPAKTFMTGAGFLKGHCNNIPVT